MSQNGANENTSGNHAADATQEEISYHAVEKNGVITAIWEMRGRRHLRTIDPRRPAILNQCRTHRFSQR